MASTLQAGSASARRGERAEGAIHVGRLADASPIEIPVAIVNGARPGKTVWMHSAVHGDEYVGVRAIQHLLAGLDPEQMQGALVAVPVANIQAFRAGVRSAPQDGLDMNRLWPGAEIPKARSLAAHTEVAVRRLVEAMDGVGVDAVIDCHAGGTSHRMANWAAYTAYGAAAPEAARLAEAAAFDVVWAHTEDFMAALQHNSAENFLAARGTPYVVLEAGGQAAAEPGPVAAMQRALENILHAMGVLDGEPDIPQPARRVVGGNWVRAIEGGLFDRKVELLDEVQVGAVIGTVHDLFGRTIEEVRAPTSGLVIGIRPVATVPSGGYIGTISELA